MTQKKIVLTLSDPENSAEQFPLKISVKDIPVAHRWFELLKKSLQLGDPGSIQLNHLEKNFCFMGFTQGKRDLLFLCRELNYFINIINKKVLKEKWSNDYYINLHFTP